MQVGRDGNIGSNFSSEFSFRYRTLFSKIGLFTLSAREIYIYPFLGLKSDLLNIKTDMDYKLRCINCFLNGSHDYSVNNLSLIYGIGYSPPLMRKTNRSFLLFTGIEAGGFIHLTDNRWKIDGEESSSRFSDLVEFGIGGFYLRVYGLIPILSRRLPGLQRNLKDY